MKREITTFKIATTFIGTVLGAGFASGQEILQFFGFFGRSGIAALGLTTIFFIVFGIMILEMGHQSQARSYLDLISFIGGRKGCMVMDKTITFFLFGTQAIMIAGAGAIFSQQFGLPGYWGCLAVMSASIVTVLFGMAGVISAMGVIIPLLLVFILLVGTGTILLGFPHLAAVPYSADPSLAPVSFWPFSSLLYASCNLVIGVAILGPLGGMAEKRFIKRGVFWGGLGIGGSALAILLAVLIHYQEAGTYQIPMLYIAGQLLSPLPALYSLVLLAGMYTGTVGSLYGFAARWSSPFYGIRFKLLVAASSLGAFAAAQIGFSSLVRLLYPLAGLAGLVMLGGIAYKGFLGGLRRLTTSPQPGQR